MRTKQNIEATGVLMGQEYSAVWRDGVLDADPLVKGLFEAKFAYGPPRGTFANMTWTDSMDDPIAAAVALTTLWDELKGFHSDPPLLPELAPDAIG